MAETGTDRADSEVDQREHDAEAQERKAEQRELLNVGSEERGPELGDPVERDLVGQKVIDPHGDKVGTIEALLIHGDAERPNWARVKFDPIGIRSGLIPLQDAQDIEGTVRIVYEREWVRAAPEVEPEDEKLSDEDAEALHSHYGLERVMGLTTVDDEIELPRETRDAKPPSMDEGALPKPPIPGIPEDEQPSPVKQEEDEEGSRRESSEAQS